jgi:hypothetical protein
MSKKAKGLMARQPPLQLPITSLQEARAFKALAKGEADDRQQELVFKYMVTKLGMVGTLAFWEGQSELTGFCSGRQWVGLQIVHLVETSMDVLRRTSLTLTKTEEENYDRRSE